MLVSKEGGIAFICQEGAGGKGFSSAPCYRLHYELLTSAQIQLMKKRPLPISFPTSFIVLLVLLCYCVTVLCIIVLLIVFIVYCVTCFVVSLFVGI